MPTKIETPPIGARLAITAANTISDVLADLPEEVMAATLGLLVARFVAAHRLKRGATGFTQADLLKTVLDDFMAELPGLVELENKRLVESGVDDEPQKN